jgi:YVTN family beta-propeller protein
MFRSQNFQQIKTAPAVSISGLTKFVVYTTTEILLIDATSETIESTFTPSPLPSYGYDIAYGDGKIAVSEYSASGTVSFYDALTFAYITSVSVGVNPIGIDYSSGYFFVACSSGTGIFAINSSTYSIASTFTENPNPFCIAAGNGIIAATEYSNFTSSVYLYNANTLSFIGTVPSGSYGSAIGNGDGKFVASNYLSDSVTIFSDTSPYSVVATVTVGTNPYISKNAFGNGYFAVPNYGSGNVSIIQSSTNTVVETVSTASGPMSAVYELGKFAITHLNGDVYFIDSISHTVTGNLGINVNGSGIVAI